MFQKDFKERFKLKINQNKKKEINNNNRLFNFHIQDYTQLEREISQNNLTWNIPVSEPITSHRKFIGPSLVFIKKVIRKILYWLVTKPFLQQREFNASITRSLNELYRDNKSFNNHYNNQLDSLNQIYNKIIDLENKINYKIEEYNQSFFNIGQILKDYKINESIEQRLSSIENKYSEKEKDEDFNINYVEFEDRFRGNEANIKEEQVEVYLPFIPNGAKILDVGCGRGELISAMQERGFVTTGIDLNSDMIDHLKNKGLNVHHMDAIQFLKETNENFDAIISLHVIEHLKPGQILELVRTAYENLNKDGVLILETPNPECLYNLAFGFTIDMTHIKPVHAYTLRFILEEVGFTDIKVKHLKPVDDKVKLEYVDEHIEQNKIFNKNMEKINTLLYSYQNYAIIGKK
ncbi:class I SAM-dependent methyltransferase [Paenibacillus filicis]|uniref:Class I SAM-dependent methyltransferase n=1 Tax=Paenibacillus gyeongsangnamensis TaxID=3388067 RepID=A0ABT4Q6Q5_9BACL|nr:class I SAM-dependent methyltransferase [Paenibacillus filicis]MCZ8512554.1 class I SAM-dependent methyltransferase [Paenibacillus filicis]